MAAVFHWEKYRTATGASSRDALWKGAFSSNSNWCVIVLGNGLKPTESKCSPVLMSLCPLSKATKIFVCSDKCPNFRSVMQNRYQSAQFGNHSVEALSKNVSSARNAFHSKFLTLRTFTKLNIWVRSSDTGSTPHLCTKFYNVHVIVNKITWYWHLLIHL